MQVGGLERNNVKKEFVAVPWGDILTPAIHGGSAKQSCEYKRTCPTLSFLTLTLILVIKLFLLFLVVNAPPYNKTCETAYRGKPIKISWPNENNKKCYRAITLHDARP